MAIIGGLLGAVSDYDMGGGGNSKFWQDYNKRKDDELEFHVQRAANIRVSEQIESLQLKLATGEACKAALDAQIKALSSELKRVDPGNHLFKNNGVINKKGNRQTFLGAIWEKVFDSKVHELLGSDVDASQFRSR